MYYEWHINKLLNKENTFFLTIFKDFRQILVAFKYFVQPDWRISPSFKLDSCCSIFSFLRCRFFVDHCLSFCPFSFGHCIACPSIYDFRQSFWHLQTFLICWPIHAPLYYPNYQIYFIVICKNTLKITLA